MTNPEDGEVEIEVAMTEDGHTLVRNLADPNIWHDIGKAARDAADATDPAAGAEDADHG